MDIQNPVSWFEIYVQDMPRAQAFYEQVFQCQLEDMKNPHMQEWTDMEMKLFPMNEKSYGCGGGLVKMGGHTAGNNAVLVYFASENCSELERVEAAGGRIFKPKISIGKNGYIALFYDTENNMIGLHSMQ